jgi:hypothetical protein
MRTICVRERLDPREQRRTLKNLFVSLMVMVAVNLTASSAHADDCSESDRVALPLCAKSGLIQGTIVGRFVQNLCSHPITVKFAQSGSDVRRDIPAGTRHEEKPLANDVAVSCCPRYNSCEDHRPGMPPNLALRKPATQSSIQNDAVAARAVDGNSDGDYHHWSVTHTTSTAQSWWQVDLGVPQGLREVVLFNRTDAAPERLSNFDIKVSTDGSTWTTVATVASTPPQRSTYPINATGRYVRVQLRGTNPLSLAEVQVYGRNNLALRKPATQSSLQNDAVAARGVDGNSDGNYQNGSVTHTTSTAGAWWQVDLGAAQSLREIVLSNRTDCCADRLSNFDIKVSNDGSTWTTVATVAGTAPQRSVHPINATGRYVRVQLRGTNNLSLAEVEVYGP